MSQADIIIENASILTMSSAMPRASAIALRGGRILAVADRETVAGLRSSSTRMIDAGGASVLPGFIDSHIHIFPGGAQIKSLSLAGVNGFDAIASAVRQRAAREPHTKILIVEQAGYNMFGDEPITRQLLDRVLPDRPLAFFASDHHTMWANTAALELAGVLHGREMPPGNEVVMGPDGLATGELREFEGFAPITDLTPTGGREMLGLLGHEPKMPPTAAQRDIDRAILRDGLAYCASLGITSFHNMDGNFYQLELLEEIDRAEGGLPVRAYMPFRMLPDCPLSDLQKAVEMRRRWDSDTLRAGFVKIFMDGVIESTTAHMFEDYVGMPGVRGSSFFDQPAFDAICVEADKHGLQIAVHAIGDEAVNITLNGYEAAQKANGKRDSRHRIEHIEMLLPADLPRFTELGVIASVQPTHAPGGYYPPEPILSMVGRERMMTGYAWQTIRKTGAQLVFASDWPVAPLDPLLGIKTAVVRQPVFDGAPDEKQSLMDSLAGFTADGAYTEFMEGKKGVLKEGALADLVVLSSDIEKTPPQDVDAMKVQATICGGKIIYER